MKDREQPDELGIGTGYPCERKTPAVEKSYSRDQLVKAMWYGWSYAIPFRPADKTYREMIQPDFDKWIDETLK